VAIDHVHRHGYKKRPMQSTVLKTGGRKTEVEDAETEGASTTIRGIIIPVDWDDEGKALSAVLSSPGENDYIIEQNSQGRALMRLLRQEVEASGIIGGEGKGRKKLIVKAFKVVKDR
jgi:hypothetical protein